MKFRDIGKLMAASFLSLFAVVVVSGCERKEKVFDLETPAGEVEVERSEDSGEVDVEIRGKEEGS